nr:MAG TPA: TT viral orf 1 [Anelloviridae sp.]
MPTNASYLRHISQHTTTHNDIKQKTQNNKMQTKQPIQKTIQKSKNKTTSILQNNWYFQKDFAPEPLLLSMSSSMSLDRHFLNSQSISSTMVVISLNDTVFDFYNYKIPPTTG